MGTTILTQTSTSDVKPWQSDNNVTVDCLCGLKWPQVQPDELVARIPVTLAIPFLKPIFPTPMFCYQS